MKPRVILVVFIGAVLAACSGYEGGGDVRVAPVTDSGVVSDGGLVPGPGPGPSPRDGGIDSPEPRISTVLGYWPLDSNGTDSSPASSTSKHHLQVVSGSFTSGQVGSALVLTNQGFTAQLSQAYPDLDFGDRDFTVQAWIAAASVAVGVGTGPFGPSLEGWALYTTQGAVGFRSNDPRGILSAVLPTSTVMRHIVARRESGTLSLFADGVLVASRDDAAPIGSASAFGIQQSGTTSGTQKSRVDEVVIWSRALSDAEIQALRSLGQSGQPPDLTE